ncbi:MAG TPA: CATRA system-associated protein [Pseudonocardiaceae bacterium]|nr:CATRA system-associated protein [Pseudonocardiaceae bacterium]
MLTDVLEWQLVPQRWERVERIVDSLAEALAGGDAVAMREATAELELAGPVRATRIGTTPLVPVPEQVRDRANHLVHSLGGTPRQPPGDPADSSGKRGGGGDRKPTG